MKKLINQWTYQRYAQNQFLPFDMDDRVRNYSKSFLESGSIFTHGWAKSNPLRTNEPLVQDPVAKSCGLYPQTAGNSGWVIPPVRNVNACNIMHRPFLNRGTSVRFCNSLMILKEFCRSQFLQQLWYFMIGNAGNRDSTKNRQG